VTAPTLLDVSSPAGNDASCPAVGERRICAWCHQSIPGRVRRDAVCCSKRCRQARHRFGRGVARTAGVAPSGGCDASRVARAEHDPSTVGRVLRLAYADPPYPGKAWLYRGHPDYAGEVDHTALIARLRGYDGWALSTSAAALPMVLAACPPGVRVAAWHRGERPTASRWPLNAWEPVIYHGGRAADASRLDTSLQTRRVDSLVHGVAAMTTLPGRVIGTKPAAFCGWIFSLLGAQPGDTFDDLYPGSGAVSRAWHAYTTGQPPEVSHKAQHDASRPPAEATNSRSSKGPTNRCPSSV
jgi:hypothetical protein